MRGGRSYRSKIEVLRDFLKAAQEPVPKTRLIGTANLNPVSFQRYLRICTERDLITTVSGGYVATPRARPLLDAINGLMLTTTELERAFRVIGHNGLNGHPSPAISMPAPPVTGNGRASRQVLRQAWNEIVLRPAPRPAMGPAHPPGNGIAPPSAVVRPPQVGPAPWRVAGQRGPASTAGRRPRSRGEARSHPAPGKRPRSGRA